MYKISDDNDDKFAREFRNFGDQNCVYSTRKLYLNKWHFENSLIFTVAWAVMEFAMCGHFTTLKQINGNNFKIIWRYKLYN